MNSKMRALLDWNRGMENYGISVEDRFNLRRIEMTLHRWAEGECGDSNDFASWCIERDEETGKPFRVVHSHAVPKAKSYPIADREAGALKRLKKIMVAYPDLVYYHQGDPRGCALYIVRKSDIPSGESLDAFYTRGICANY